MARNQEKAQAMLNRLVQAKKDAARPEKEVRPYLASEVEDLGAAERWRGQVIREIAKGVTEIQNGSLGEHKIRDLNDNINKLLREKKHWERQIKLLGGPDYLAGGQKITDSDGRTAMGQNGYYYFGVAKELPGVRELFERQTAETVRRTRYELYKLVDGDYYGYRDDDDGLLVKLEQTQEKKARGLAEKEWRDQQRELKRMRLSHNKQAPQEDEDFEVQREGEVQKAFVDLPSDDEIQRALLHKKKQELLAKYSDVTKAELLFDKYGDASTARGQ
jgi:pre-mRNA-splicing factor ISY1